MDTELTAANGKKVKALEIFAYALQYFKEQALKVGTYQSLYWEGAPPARQFLGRECGLRIQKPGCPHVRCWWGGNMGQLLWRTAWQFLKRLNTGPSLVAQW